MNKVITKQTKCIEVLVDSQIINTAGLGCSVLQMCESIGARCITQDQFTSNTVTWQLRHLDTAGATLRVEELDEVLSIVPVKEFVLMVHSHVQKAKGQTSSSTLTDFVKQLQQIYHGKHLTVALHGLDKYFNDQKLASKRKHREEVTGQKSKASRNNVVLDGDISITRFNVEETLVVTQLETGCACKLLDTAHSVAELIKCLTKATADKPDKKERLDGVFSFLEEGGSGVKADKTGCGLLKVWKLQLQQLNNMGPEMAAAIAAHFPSPLALKQVLDDALVYLFICY